MAMAALLACDPGTDGPEREQWRSGWSTQAYGGLTAAVYTPASSSPIGQGRSLLLVLHGCAQTYGDLQSYGQWADTAQDHGMVVSLPGVPGGGVYFGCWDYYGSSHSRQSGHAAALLAHVDALLADPSLDIDPDQVYIAGLSSGGGMAMVMGCLAPDVFAGVGIAAGPTVGTSSFEISAVSTDLATATATCEALAGSAEGSFATQMAATIAGTGDYTVAQGYAELNADVFAALYAERAGLGSLSTAPLVVADLPGYEPAGTGTRYSDGLGPRVATVSAAGMGHAWPAGSGPGPEIGFVATEGVDFAATLAAQFTANNRRAAPGTGDGGSDTGGDTGGDAGATTSGGDTGGDAGTTTSGGDTGGDAGTTTSGDDTGGDAGTTTSGGEPCDPWIDAVSATISGHFSRFGVYPGGYGVADITYVELFSMYGMSTPFLLYQAPGGDWYYDPANIPAQGCP